MYLKNLTFLAGMVLLACHLMGGCEAGVEYNGDDTPPIGGGGNWAPIKAGNGYTTAVGGDRTLWAWGQNRNGQLGDGGMLATRPLPTKIGINKNWEMVDAGFLHTAAIRTDGTLWTWGYNEYGQLGDGSRIDKNIPIQIGNDQDWVVVHCGEEHHTLAIKADGTLWAWGHNNSGQLGDGTTSDKYVPTQIANDTNWVHVSEGAAIRTNGTLWAWGFNAFGQVGNGTTTNQYSPVKIGNDTDWETVYAGYTHTAAIKADGTLWTWGYNNHGQLGDGTTFDQHVPTRVGTHTNWIMVVCGDRHTLAIKSNGTLWGWGRNRNGELGLGTTVDSNVPRQVGTETNWLTVSAGDDHSSAMKKNGTLWSWGGNSYGQIGDGSTMINRYTPTLISTGTQ